MNTKKIFAVVLAVAFVSSLATVFALHLTARANGFGDFFKGLLGRDGSGTNVNAPPPAPTTPYQPPVDYEQKIVGAVEKASPSVISIIISKDLPVIEQSAANPLGDVPPEFRDFFGPLQLSQPCQKGTKLQEVGGGSGFIVSSDGLIVTNKHVVSDEKASYTVLTNDGKRYDATVLARDPAQDIAIVKIKPSGSLPVLALGNSDSIKLGQTAIAIGNALGEFRNTVSVGIISGLSRSIDASSGSGDVERLEGLIQTDAAINPGNSGGPLLNLRGEDIGMNTAIASGAENISFTIPINQAKRDIASVKKNGKISSPFLGVRYFLITHDVADREKLSVKEGVIVRGNDQGPAVVPGSPADKGGIHAEDIILKLNGENITSNHSLASLIQKYNVGDTVTLDILRSGKEMTLSVTLVERQ